MRELLWKCYGNIREKSQSFGTASTRGRRMNDMSSKLTIDETEPTIMEVGLDISHTGCFLSHLAGLLDQHIMTQIPNDPVEDSVVHIYFAVTQSFSRSELERLFGKFNGNFVQARVSAPPRRPTFFDLKFEDSPMSKLFSISDSTVKTYVATPKKEKVTIELRGINVQDVTAKMQDIASVDLSFARRIPTPDLAQELLTPNDVGILQSLIDWGFFELPRRRITLEQAATKLDMKDSTLSLQMRTISDRVFREYLRRAMVF